MSKSQPQIAALQMISSRDVTASLEAVTRLADRAASHAVSALFLPENFAALGHPDPATVGRAEATPEGPVRQFLGDLARMHQVWVFAGTLPSASRPDGVAVPDGRVRAASLVFNPEGREVARYDKIHMFDVDVDDGHRRYRESDTFEAGDAPSTIVTDFAAVGLSVCYDIRFPEVYRQLFDQGAELITVPSAFTVPTGRAHFEVLLRARAIENFSYVVAACQGGQHDSGRETWGHSMIVSPWGEILAEAGEGEDVIVAELDLDRLHDIRRAMPTHQQRRL